MLTVEKITMKSERWKELQNIHHTQFLFTKLLSTRVKKLIVDIGRTKNT